jgi:hypothetical protein
LSDQSHPASLGHLHMATQRRGWRGAFFVLLFLFGCSLVAQAQGQCPPAANPLMVIGPQDPPFASDTVRYTVAGPISVSTWQVQGIDWGNATFGTIDERGVFTAPATVAGGGLPVRITALSQGGAYCGMANLVIMPRMVAISPKAATVRPNGQIEFTATVPPGTDATSIVWQVDGIQNGDNLHGYLPPSTVGPWTVYTAPPSGVITSVLISASVAPPQAAANQPGAYMDRALVLIGDQSMAVQPHAATVLTSGRIHFTRTGIMGPNGLPLPVRWLVNGVEGGNAGFGRIDPNGNYTAPSTTTVASSVSISAVSADPAMSFSGSASVVIVSPSCLTCLQIAVKARGVSTSKVIPPLTSYPMEAGKKVTFYAKRPDGAPVEAIWSIKGDANRAGGLGNQKDAGNDLAFSWTGQYLEYVAPASGASPSITITATPTAQTPGLSGASVSVLVMSDLLFHCATGNAANTNICRVDKFKRTAASTGLIGGNPVANNMDAGKVNAVNSAKTVFSGSVLTVHLSSKVSALCSNYDWKIVTQAVEASNIFIYDPSDVGSGVCEGDDFIVGLPVHVVWADVYGFHQQLDPSRGGPGKPSSFTDCTGQPQPETVAPCDKDLWVGSTFLYHFGWPYNYLITPGTGQGSVTLAPSQGSLNIDIQADPGIRKGPGWINMPIVFERAPTVGSDLNSLMMALAYDFRSLAKPDVGTPRGSSLLVLRKPQTEFRTGYEKAPSYDHAVSTTPYHDWNYVSAAVERFPIILNLRDQPSSLSLYPTFALEGGHHLITHPIPGAESGTDLNQSNPILRGVVGADASFRWPFNVTHNFLGSTPITIDASYRARWLVFDEPWTDFADALPPPPAGAPANKCKVKAGLSLACVATETLSSKTREFYRVKLALPIDPYVSVSLTLLGGSLPPDYWHIGKTFTVGLTVSNPASSEH